MKTQLFEGPVRFEEDDVFRLAVKADLRRCATDTQLDLLCDDYDLWVADLKQLVALTSGELVERERQITEMVAPTKEDFDKFEAWRYKAVGFKIQCERRLGALKSTFTRNMADNRITLLAVLKKTRRLVPESCHEWHDATNNLLDHVETGGTI